MIAYFTDKQTITLNFSGKMIRQADDIRDCFGITFPDAKLMENCSVVHAL
jgi:hypothetical protein